MTSISERLAAKNATRRRSAILCVLIFVLIAGRSQAQLPVVSLRALSQSFFVPGGEYEIGVAEGAQTEEVKDLIVSHPGIAVELLPGAAKPFSSEANPRYGNFRFHVADSVPIGRYEVRAVGRFGVSNPRAIVVVGQAQAVTDAPHTVESAVQLKTGVLYHRQASSAARDHYRVSVTAGKTYHIQLIGHSIDSRLIGAVSLTNDKGRTILSKIGSDQSDLTHSFIAEESEIVTLVVHDALFRGGASYQYGLRVVEGNAPSDFEAAKLPKVITANVSDDGSIQAAISNGETSTTLQVPFQIEATFGEDRDLHQYLCRLSKGKTVRMDVVSDRVGEPTDARLVVERATGGEGDSRTWQRVATSEDGYNLSDSVIRLGTVDPVLDFTPPEDGDYRITVSDLDSGSSLSESQRFSLTVREPESDWQLLAYRVYPNKDAKASRPAGTQLIRGGGIVVRVFAVRQRMNEPIRVSVADLPEGLTCRPAWIAANQSQVDLVITASPQAEAGVLTCKVIGEIENASPESGSPERKREAKYATVAWEQDGYRPFIQTRLTDQLLFAVSDLDSHPMTIATESGDPIAAKKGSKVTVSIKLQRSDSAKQNVVLRARNLPPGVKAGDLTIPADKSEAQWTIDVSGKATPGKYSFWGQGETKVKFSVNPQSLTRITKYLEELKAAKADPANSERHGEIDKLIAETQKQVEAVKKQVAPRDFTVYIPMPLITLEIQ